ncbi:f3fddecd-5a43-4800-8eb1-10b872931a79 [Thermothielavioides terrestris]|uniref:Carboxylic ester hydrolase n=1 Tax=Thermothielavioides terrestris TaxID=2587410 RepID=A0A446BVW6_9PEZI|nr:f3fddecd-5a43-4800-8eb1-10b872931a79 [Thermothielavioides terrestris]
MRFRLVHAAFASSLAAVAQCSGSNSCSNGNSNDNSFQQRCSKLASQLKIENATVWFSEYVAANTNISFPDTDPSCGQGPLSVGVDFCRVSLRVATSSRSSISMEAWLPRNWTGRFLSTGNGGLNGCLSYDDMAYTTELGFSTVGANNGHNGTSGAPFLNNPEVVTDFAWRSVHTNVVVGKSISKTFYRQQHKKSYYLGCSTGGRQGFMSAQSFPDDFDGIVAGAPALDFNNLNSWSGHFYLLTGAAGSPTYLTPDQWTAVHQDILAQCDGIDGAVDGIIEDPELCQYRPESLICPPGTPANTSTCITGTQAATVRAVFSDLYGENGTLVYPRMQPGSELLGEAYIYYAGQPFQYSVDWFRYVVYNNPNWDPATLGPADYAYSDALNPADIRTWSGDLSAARARGVKILHYHGQQDQIITSANSPRYYNHVAQTMSLPSSALDDFYRFFRISGMGHCSGGPGAVFIGNQRANTASLDPDQNVLTAVVRWVEQGKAPDAILGTAFVNGTAGGQIAFQRWHCKYPLRNTYTGKGDPKDPDSWNI